MEENNNANEREENVHSNPIVVVDARGKNILCINSIFFLLIILYLVVMMQLSCQKCIIQSKLFNDSQQQKCRFLTQ